MQDVEYKLLWLLNAMTLPIAHTDERYYYDGQRQEFFFTIKVKESPNALVILNIYDLQYSLEIESDIAVRLERINDESSEIVEIPKLNVDDKVDIQLQFLSKIEGTYCHNDLLKAVYDQQDACALDEIPLRNANLEPMETYWDYYKLKTVLQYLTRFTESIGINLRG